MKNEDFATTIVVDATAQKVFDAVNNVRGWWSENIEGDTDRTNGEFEYHYEDVHRVKMQITEFVPNQRIVWHVLDNYFKFTKDKTEWIDTDVIFEIAPKGDETELKFTHKGLVPAYECYNVCHDAWTHYVQDSLKDLIIGGTGKATPAAQENESAEGPSSDKEDSPAITAAKSI